MGPISRLCLLQVHSPGLPFPAALGTALPASSSVSLSSVPLQTSYSPCSTWGSLCPPRQDFWRGAVTGGIPGQGLSLAERKAPRTPSERGQALHLLLLDGGYKGQGPDLLVLPKVELPRPKPNFPLSPKIGSQKQSLTVFPPNWH